MRVYIAHKYLYIQCLVIIIVLYMYHYTPFDIYEVVTVFIKTCILLRTFWCKKKHFISIQVTHPRQKQKKNLNFRYT